MARCKWLTLCLAFIMAAALGASLPGGAQAMMVAGMGVGAMGGGMQGNPFLTRRTIQ